MTARDVVKGFLDQLAGGDAATIVAMFTDDAVIDMPGGDDLPWAGRWQGRAAIQDYFQVMPAALAMHEHVIDTWVVGRRHGLRQRRGGRFLQGQRQALSGQVVLGLHRARRQDRRMGRLRGHAGPLRLRPLALGPTRLSGARTEPRRKRRSRGRRSPWRAPDGASSRSPSSRAFSSATAVGKVPPTIGLVSDEFALDRVTAGWLASIFFAFGAGFGVLTGMTGARVGAPCAPPHRHARSRPQRCRRRTCHQRRHAARGPCLRGDQLRRHRVLRAQDHLRCHAARGPQPRARHLERLHAGRNGAPPWWWPPFLAESLGWRSLWWLCAGAALVAAVLVAVGTTRRRWPEQPSRDADARFDWAGARGDGAGGRLVALRRGVPALHRSMVRGRRLAARPFSSRRRAAGPSAPHCSRRWWWA